VANIVFLDQGGASTLGMQFWDRVDNSGVGVSISTTVVPPMGAYASIQNGDGSDSTGWDAFNVFTGSGGRVSWWWMQDSQPPLGSPLLFIWGDQGGAGPIGTVVIDGTGKMTLSGGSGFPFYTGTTVLSVNQWYRFSVAWNVNGVDDMAVKVYINGVQEFSKTGVETAGLGAASNLSFGFGQAIPGDTRISWFTHIYADDGSDLSDTGNMLCTAKLPTSVNHNNWDTVIGTGAVNQRPLSETDGIESLLTSGTDQDYNLQAANIGDDNLQGCPIVGYMGWVWAKEASVAGSPALILNGTQYGITLTTSSAIYRQCVTSTLYPTNAAGIGMHSGTVATFMYECGVVVAFQQVGRVTPMLFAGR